MKNRSEIDSIYKWEVSHIFASKEEFEATLATVRAIIRKIPEYIGNLGKKVEALELLTLMYDGTRKIAFLSGYADRNRDVDMAVSENQELVGKVEDISSQFAASTSFVEPEFLSLDASIIESYMQDVDFSNYSRYFESVLRNKPHTLSNSEEKILAKYSAIHFADYEIYSTFTSADMPFPEVTLSDGTKIEVNTSNYSVYRQSNNRADRKIVFDAFWQNYGKFGNSFAKMLHYQIKLYSVNADIRNFGNSLEKALNGTEIPVEFYGNLTKNIREILPSLHEYLRLKKEILGIDELGYHDIYASLITSSVKRTFDYETSCALIEKSMAPMSDEYKNALSEGMKPGSGWVDVYPNKGKRSGAYMSGEVYGVHPFVLLNHIDDYNSASTLTHEMGHAMHSWFSNKYQPYQKSQYTIFVAEVASIFNEIMLINTLIDEAEDVEEKKFLINHFIEMIRTTIFRQMQFAEFEDKIYKKVESGESLTPDFLNGEYLQTLKDYYGEESGVIKIDPLYSAEWSFIPHFYYNYYVYQYVVGFIGALYLAEKVRKKEIPAAQYIDGFLKAGSSKPPLEILKDAGVDMMSEEPYLLVGKIFREKLALLKEMVYGGN